MAISIVFWWVYSRNGVPCGLSWARHLGVILVSGSLQNGQLVLQVLDLRATGLTAPDGFLVRTFLTEVIKGRVSLIDFPFTMDHRPPSSPSLGFIQALHKNCRNVPPSSLRLAAAVPESQHGRSFPCQPLLPSHSSSRSPLQRPKAGETRLRYRKTVGQEMVDDSLKTRLWSLSLYIDCINIYICTHIRRPRQTKGGARQGIIYVVM